MHLYHCVLQQRYSHNPLSFIRIIKHCLQTELKLVQQVENVGVTPFPLFLRSRATILIIFLPKQPQATGQTPNALCPTADSQQKIAQQLDYIRRRTQETEEDLRRMQQEQESFVIQYQESTKLQGQVLPLGPLSPIRFVLFIFNPGGTFPPAHIQQIGTQTNGQTQVEAEQKLRRQKELVDQMLSEKATALLQMRLALADKHKETFVLLNTLQSHVLDDVLIRWKREQQQSGNGGAFNNNLDQIQEWYGSFY